MGLPPYFSATTLRTIVAEGGHADDGPVREVARRAHLDVLVGEGRDAELAAEMFVELAARTLGSLRIQTSSPASERALLLKARSINPRIAESPSPDDSVTSVSFGGASDAADIRLWSRGWWLGFAAPDASAPDSSSLGALAAGAIAFDLAFAQIFASVLPTRQESTRPAGWSLRRWTSGSASADDCAPMPSVDLPHTVLIGCGAIGQAVCYALARAGVRGGPLTLVDPQTLSLTNLQRYVGSQFTDVTNHMQKVVLAARTLGHGPSIQRYAGRDWATYRRETPTAAPPEIAITALDTALARRLVQAALPRVIFNGWTRTTDCGATMHVFNSTEQCLSCTYLPRDAAAPLNDFRLLAIELGLDPLRIVQLLAVGSLRPADLRSVERHRRLPEDSLKRWRGESVRSLYGELCGVVNVRSDARHDYVVPLPQASALAGILVVAQLLKYVSGLAVSTRPVEVSLLPAPGPIWELPPARKADSPVACICKDAAYLAAYDEIWAA